jgi:hypothetical protein
LGTESPAGRKAGEFAAGAEDVVAAEKLGPKVRLLPAEDVEAGWREK